MKNHVPYEKEQSLKKLLPLLIFSLFLTACGRWYQVLCIPGEETRLMLLDAVAGSGPSELKEKTAEPIQKQVTFTIEGKEYQADIFQPGEPALAALVLLPGTTTDGKNDPRLVSFAKTIARTRFNVLIPDLKNLKALKITPGDADEIAAAFQYLVNDSNLAPNGRAGIAAVSYAVGPTMLAALKPSIRDKVRFILSIGGYYDLNRVITYITTGQYRDEQGNWAFREPNVHGKWVFILSNTDRLSNEQDRNTLNEIARIKIANPEAPIVDLTDKLVSQEGQALLNLMNNKDPQLVEHLIQKLPSSVKEDLKALNLSEQDFSKFKARVYMIHGLKDDLIPYTESLDLDKKLPTEHTLHIIDGFRHVEFDGELDFFNALSMACSSNKLLEERFRNH